MKADDQLKQDVQAELSWDPTIVSPHIRVQAEDGVVTLSGRVASLAEKLAAEDAARRVSGLRALAVDLVVVIPGHARRSDTEIAQAARQALDWCVLVPAGQVVATVEAAHVELQGEVERPFQRRAAERAVRGLRGVASVVNHIRLRSPVDEAGIERRLCDALSLHSLRDRRDLAVAIDGTTVRLSGHLPSWAERDAAAAALRSQPGVERLVNDVVVSP